MNWLVCWQACLCRDKLRHRLSLRIGRAIALRVAMDGIDIAIVDLNEDKKTTSAVSLFRIFRFQGVTALILMFFKNMGFACSTNRTFGAYALYKRAPFRLADKFICHKFLSGFDYISTTGFIA
jgi:hypothetical protein